jgi:hypothetical protein
VSCSRPGIPAALLLVLACGCAQLGSEPASFDRPFRFSRDSFAFANELIWSYDFDSDGTWRGSPRLPRPSYTHRCFVLVRTARQFFESARFAPELPPPDPETLRTLVHRVAREDPRRPLPEEERVVIPGFASLRELSRARESLLKEEIGGVLWSYTERGNWRMVIPFTRAHQRETAERLVASLERNRPPIVHLVRFPRISINHAVLLFAYAELPGSIRFQAYDPNAPDAPTTLTFDRASRTFTLPRNSYFHGGRVDVYEIYDRPWD